VTEQKHRAACVEEAQSAAKGVEAPREQADGVEVFKGLLSRHLCDSVKPASPSADPKCPVIATQEPERREQILSRRIPDIGLGETEFKGDRPGPMVISATATHAPIGAIDRAGETQQLLGDRWQARPFEEGAAKGDGAFVGAAKPVE
jgi:hypothetical protein